MVSEYAIRFSNYRFTYNLTQKELADILGISRNYVNKIEHSNREPSERLKARFRTLVDSNSESKTRFVKSSVWNDRSLLPDEKLMYLYLITNPHTNSLGIYKLPINTAAKEVGLSEEVVKTLINRLKELGLIEYSEENKTVTVIGDRIKRGEK